MWQGVIILRWGLSWLETPVIHACQGQEGDWSHPCSIKLGLRCHGVPTDSLLVLFCAGATYSKLCSWMAVCTFFILFKLLQKTPGQPHKSSAFCIMLRQGKINKRFLNRLWGQHTHSFAFWPYAACRVHLHTKHEPGQRPPLLRGAQFERLLRLSFVNTVSAPGWKGSCE